jgi:UDP-GlcNAc3NAcA epimerase
MGLTVATILGARPQFIKAFPVSAALSRHGVDEVLIHTGQHHDQQMSQVFFDELELPPPKYHLGIAGGSHATMTGRMLPEVESVLIADSPAAVLVYGDTNSTLAGALAAAKLSIPVVHVEAGLRSFNRRMPEEINRVLVDHLSALLFAPTTRAVANLAAEGIHDGVQHVGDVMYDATLQARALSDRSKVLDDLGIESGTYAVATVHRAENTDDRLQLATLLDYLRNAAREQALVLPLHPRTRIAVDAAGLDLEGIVVTDPLSYLDMTRLVANAALVLTDSGGLQKEAYFHRVPCVTLRSETEWQETIEAGWNRLWTSADYAPRTEIDEYGGGRAADRVAAAVLSLVQSIA